MSHHGQRRKESEQVADGSTAARPLNMVRSLCCIALVVALGLVAVGTSFYVKSTRGYSPFALVGILLAIPTILIGIVQAALALVFLFRQRSWNGAARFLGALGLFTGAF